MAANYLYTIDWERYYRIYDTVHQMLSDRGFDPVKPQLSLADWKSNIVGVLSELEDPDTVTNAFEIIDSLECFFKKRRPRQKSDPRLMHVYFYPLDTKLTQQEFHYVYVRMQDAAAQQLLIVVNTSPTPKVTSMLNNMGNNAQIFTEQELSFNITRHQLVPKHIRVDAEERNTVLQTYTIKDGIEHSEWLPGLHTIDPICKYYNWVSGDIIRIERPRKDGFVNITYRIVTQPLSEK